MPSRSRTPSLFTERLEHYCRQVLEHVRRHIGAPTSLRITWPDGSYWACAFNLEWVAQVGRATLRSEEADALELPSLPLPALKALRKNHPALKGFFRGSEGQDTLRDDDLLYEPSEYACWVMGIFDDAIGEVHDRLQRSRPFSRCRLDIAGHDGASPLGLAKQLAGVGTLREQHEYEPTRDFLREVLSLFTDDDKTMRRWLKHSPGRTTKEPARRARVAPGPRDAQVAKLDASDDRGVKVDLLEKLGEMRDPHLAAVFERYKVDKDQFVSEAAARALRALPKRS